MTRSRFFASVPFPEVKPSLDRITGAGMHLEIEVLDSHWILDLCRLPVVAKLGDNLRERGFRVHVQGPFYDLAPGSLDPYIREHTRKLFVRSAEIAGSLRAENLTLYTGYNPLYHAGAFDQWLELCLPVWRETLETAQRFGLTVLFSNMFEEGPEVQKSLLDAFADKPAGACLNAPHAFCYSTKKAGNWISALAGSLRQLHLYDIRGRDDARLSMGTGDLPLREFLEPVMKRKLEPDIVFKLPLDMAIESLRKVRSLGLEQYQMELL